MAHLQYIHFKLTYYVILAKKHHTSKLRDFDDLSSVLTFGFRGEALSSLTSVSSLVVTTRHVSQPTATRIEYNSDGSILAQTQVAREPGTMVALSNLFHSLPVRQREFQKHIKKVCESQHGSCILLYYNMPKAYKGKVKR